MVAYNMITKRVVLGWCISYCMCAYSMNGDEEEFADDTNKEPRTSYSLFNTVNMQTFTRYLPACLYSERTVINMPAPTEPSRIATISSNYSKREIAMIAGLVVLTGSVAYLISRTCHICTEEVSDLQQKLAEAQLYINDLTQFFETCEEKSELCYDTCSSVIETCKDYCGRMISNSSMLMLPE